MRRNGGEDRPLLWPCCCGQPPILAQPRVPRRRGHGPGAEHSGGGGRGGLPASCSSRPPQDPTLRLSLVRSVCMASQAICGSAQGSAFHFSRKAELVVQMTVSVGRAGPRPP